MRPPLLGTSSPFSPIPKASHRYINLSYLWGSDSWFTLCWEIMARFRWSPCVFQFMRGLILSTAREGRAFNAVHLGNLFISTRCITRLLIIRPIFRTRVLSQATRTYRPILGFTGASARFFGDLFIGACGFRVLSFVLVFRLFFRSHQRAPTLLIRRHLSLKKLMVNAPICRMVNRRFLLTMPHRDTFNGTRRLTRILIIRRLISIGHKNLTIRATRPIFGPIRPFRGLVGRRLRNLAIYLCRGAIYLWDMGG